MERPRLLRPRRNLHRCAQAVAAEHDGKFPRSAAQLAEAARHRPSTAAAIAAFCFGERVAILDGNVKRVLTRVLAYDRDIAQSALREGVVGHRHQPAADAPAGEPLHAAMATYTQGLMDLGATVCTIRRPACDACPAHAMCAGPGLRRAREVPREDPQAQARQARRACCCGCSTRIACGWCAAPTRAWAQLWSLPEFDTAVALERAVEPWPGTLEWMAPFKHVLTHFDWMLQPLKLQWHGAVSPAQQREIALLGAVNVSTANDEPGEADVHGDVAPGDDDDVEASVPAAVSEGRWFARADLDGVGVPSPIRKLLDAALPD